MAYAGIPDVFFTWIRRSDKRIRFEFLDNTVPFGEPPRSVAFGDNRVLNVLDVGNLINIDRFARIDVNARSAEAIYPNRELLAARHNTRFLSRCIETFHEVNFADQASGRIYLRMRDGRPAAKDSAVISSAMADPDTRAGLYAVMSESQLAKTAAVQVAEYLPPPRGAGQLATLGSWATRP